MSGIASQLTLTAVNTILAEMRQLQASGQHIVSMMRGEPDFDTPAHVVAAAQAALAQGRTRYPDNRGEMVLRQAVSDKLARDNGLHYDPASEVLVTTGATLGLHAALTALLQDGDEVLVPDPIYDAYTSPIVLARGRVRRVPAEICDGRFRLTAEAVERAVTPSARVLLLNSPWNPVGTVFRTEELAALAGVATRHDLTIISDEIYESIVFGDARHVSPAALSGEMRARTVVVNSLSKTYAMTGWRVGYCAGPADVIGAMFLVLQQSSRGPATFVQDAAAAALAGPQDAVDAMRAEYARRRGQVMASLAGLPRVRVLAPEGGFFAMVDIRQTGVPSNDARRRLLREHGVAVVHGAAYGPGGEGTLRVSFGSGGDALEHGLARLREGLATL